MLDENGMSTIFRSFLLFVVLLSGKSFAQDLVIALNQEDALKACEEKASQLPQDSRDEMLTSCQCTVKHIDFSQAAALNEASRTDELQALYDKAAESSCPSSQ